MKRTLFVMAVSMLAMCMRETSAITTLQEVIIVKQKGIPKAYTDLITLINEELNLSEADKITEKDIIKSIVHVRDCRDKCFGLPENRKVERMHIVGNEEALFESYEPYPKKIGEHLIKLLNESVTPEKGEEIKKWIKSLIDLGSERIIKIIDGKTIYRLNSLEHEGGVYSTNVNHEEHISGLKYKDSLIKALLYCVYTSQYAKSLQPESSSDSWAVSLPALLPYLSVDDHVGRGLSRFWSAVSPGTLLPYAFKSDTPEYAKFLLYETYCDYFPKEGGVFDIGHYGDAANLNVKFYFKIIEARNRILSATNLPYVYDPKAEYKAINSRLGSPGQNNIKDKARGVSTNLVSLEPTVLTKVLTEIDAIYITTTSFYINSLSFAFQYFIYDPIIWAFLEHIMNKKEFESTKSPILIKARTLHKISPAVGQVSSAADRALSAVDRGISAVSLTGEPILGTSHARQVHSGSGLLGGGSDAGAGMLLIGLLNAYDVKS